ncbi:MAG: MarR family winged helix-turn-helix transcriptional regulator [Rickettsiales bacterium]|jgi:DNA-binding MarR family transcriptional regulator|nr:MarR family winged helix-turn-helix transcriptional regulator [Rickettsiales bacterium]
MEFPSEKFKNDSDASTGLIFIRTYNKWHAAIKNELRNAGITHPQFVAMTVLNYLSQSDEFVTQASVAKMADMDAMSVSQIIRGLERNGFLKRTANPKDTRANSVRLLKKGQEAIKRALPIVEKIDEDFFGVLAGDEKIFRHFLSQLI